MSTQMQDLAQGNEINDPLCRPEPGHWVGETGKIFTKAEAAQKQLKQKFLRCKAR